MINLKFLLHCCCDHSSTHEEEKVQKNEKKNLQDPYSPYLNQSKLIEESTVAAPFPLLKTDSTYPKLLVKVIESSKASPGTLLKINAYGLEDSKRGKADFKTFIGSHLEDKGEVINDFVIEEEEHGMGKQHILIRFQHSINKYTISDLGDGTGTFVKISNYLVLKEGYIISFGNSHMKINSISQLCDDKLSVKFLEGPKINEEFFFNSNDETILIGRMNDCRIKFEDSNMSRYQCSISYQRGRGWVLKDGANSKSSTNGTWVYVEEEFEIWDKMLFKAGKTLFEASLE